MHIENRRDGYWWSNKDKQSFCWIITLSCLFLLHEIKWHLLYLIDWQSIFFFSRMTYLYCERSWRNNYSRRGLNVHLQTNIRAIPQRNQGVGIFTEREELMQQCYSQNAPLGESRKRSRDGPQQKSSRAIMALSSFNSPGFKMSLLLRLQ